MKPSKLLPVGLSLAIILCAGCPNASSPGSGDGGGSTVTQIQSPPEAFIFGAIDALYTKLGQLIQNIFHVTIAPPSGNLTVTASATPSMASTATTVVLNAMPHAGAAPYTYQWTSLDNAVTITNATLQQAFASVSRTTTFTVTVTDSSTPARTAIANVTVTVGPAPVANTLNVAATAQATGGATALAASISGGTAPYTISWAATPATAILNPVSQNAVATITTDTTFLVNVLDSSTPQQRASSTVVVPLNGTPMNLTIAAGASASAGTGTTTVNLTATIPEGAISTGVTPLVSWWALPVCAIQNGHTLNATATVSSTTAFTVTVSDNSTTPVRIASSTVTVTITP